MLSRWAIAIVLTFAIARAGEEIRLAGDVAITVNLPALLPPLVVVQPGVSVVGDFDVEVFFVDGYYWTRKDQVWLRARDHAGTWVRVEEVHVPVAIAKSPPGRYRHYKGQGNDKGHGNDKGQGKDKGHGDDKGQGKGGKQD
jgi:hypothetical protein